MDKYQISVIRVSVALACLFGGSQAFAGNTAVNGVAARAQSMQSAFTAVADDPSAVFYNPAGLTQIEGTELEGGFIFLAPGMKYTNSSTGTGSKSSKRSFGGDLFFSTDHFGPVTLGFGAYAPFARASDFTVDAAVGNKTHSTTIMRLDFAPSAAIKLSEHVSAGLGIVASRITLDIDILGFKETCTGSGYTAQGGILLKPSESLKAGVSYRGPMKADMSGSGTITGVGKDDFTMDLKFPGTLSAGLAWQATKPLLLALDFNWEMWSYVDEIRRNYTESLHKTLGVNTLDSKDSYDIRLGAAYAASDSSEYRFGYSYATAAVPVNNMVPAQPDFNIHGISLGYSRRVRQYRFDFGYEFEYMPSRSGDNPALPGTHKMTLHTLLAGVAYKFGK